MSYKDLVKIANKLDKIGMNKDVDFIDQLLEKFATSLDIKGWNKMDRFERNSIIKKIRSLKSVLTTLTR